jgi:hypothetical protein
MAGSTRSAAAAQTTDAGPSTSTPSTKTVSALPPPPMPIQLGNMQVTPFAGTPDQDVSTWVTRFKRIQEANGWTEARAAAHLKASLVGAAESWLSAQDESKLTTVEALTSQLANAFGPLNADLVLMHRLQELQQGPTQPVEAYAAEVAAMCRRVDAAMSDRERVAHLLNGIRPVLKEHLLTTLPGELDYQKLVAAARARQAALASTRPAYHADGGSSTATMIAAVNDGHGTGATNDIDSKLQRLLNRMDSMAERLHRLELGARDDQRHWHAREERAGPPYSNYPAQGTSTYQGRTLHDGRSSGQRGGRQGPRPPHQGYNYYTQHDATQGGWPRDRDGGAGRQGNATQYGGRGHLNA